MRRSPPNITRTRLLRAPHPTHPTTIRVWRVSPAPAAQRVRVPQTYLREASSRVRSRPSHGQPPAGLHHPAAGGGRPQAVPLARLTSSHGSGGLEPEHARAPTCMGSKSCGHGGNSPCVENTQLSAPPPIPAPWFSPAP
ncbi:hypothetical protein FQA47_017163 [Oryzias melastigma]|uniref:Uncharacterized protein n=1 Tax=Oryzias melastigma TaxID=30732 RepID=A0A834F7F0_ORYME|nr:hypothetical protein FQA47_017163 [Oryzias melastigma]